MSAFLGGGGGGGTGTDTRISLTSDTTFYYRTDGVDTTAGRDGRTDSAAQAFRTPLFAYNTLCSLYDTGGFNVTIQAGSEAGTKTFLGATVFNEPWTGGGNVSVFGWNAANNGAGRLTIWDDTVGLFDTFEVRTSIPGILAISYGQVQNTSGAAGCISHKGSGPLYLGDVNTNMGGTPSGALYFDTCHTNHIACLAGPAVIQLVSPYTIQAGCFSHYLVAAGGTIGDTASIFVPSVALTGTPAFSRGFVNNQDGTVVLQAVTYTGAATGERVRLTDGGRIGTNGSSLTFFPGSGGIFGGFFLDGWFGVETGGSSYFVAGGQKPGGTLGGVSLANQSFGINPTVGNTMFWNGAGVGWASTGFADWSTTLETGWFRDAAYSIGQRNAGNAQKYSVYNTYTSGTSFERFTVDWQATNNVCYLRNEKGSGGGTARLMVPVTGTTVVGSLPAAGTAGAGARAMVTDSTVVAVGNFGNAVVGGGGNTVPVYSDGAAWLIG